MNSSYAGCTSNVKLSVSRPIPHLIYFTTLASSVPHLRITQNPEIIAPTAPNRWSSRVTPGVARKRWAW